MLNKDVVDTVQIFVIHILYMMLNRYIVHL